MALSPTTTSEVCWRDVFNHYLKLDAQAQERVRGRVDPVFVDWFLLILDWSAELDRRRTVKNELIPQQTE